MRWTDDLIAARIMEHVAVLGRMPTNSEVPNSLGCAIAKRGGFENWASRLNLPVKDSQTLLGRGVEFIVAELLRGLGHGVVRQSVRAPFDLLVNGVTRIDVKAANYNEYPHKDGSMVRGYVFAGLKRGSDCDFFVLACLQEGKPFAHFVIPAESARVTVVTVTPRSLTGMAKWTPYREQWGLIPGPLTSAEAPAF